MKNGVPAERFPERSTTEAVLAAFLVDDPDRAVVRDALLQMALDSDKPLHAGRVAAHFVDETQLPDMLALRFDERSIVAVAKRTQGLRVEGAKFAVDAEAVGPALSLHAERLRVLAMLKRAMEDPERAPRRPDTLVERVHGLRERYGSESAGYPRGPIPTVVPDERAIALHMLHRVLGRSPRLEAFMAALAAGDDTPQRLIEDSLQMMGVKAFRRPSVFGDLEEQAAVTVEGGRVRVQEAMLEIIGQGISSTRRIIASLHARLPVREKPARHQRTRVVTHDTQPEPARTAPPAHANGTAVHTPTNGDDVMASWYEKRYGAKRRRKKDARTGPLPASAHRRIKDKYGDEGKGEPQSAAMVSHFGQQQSRPFHILRENPVVFNAAVDAYMETHDCTLEEAEERVIDEYDRRSKKMAGEPADEVPREDRSSWVTMPTPPKSARDPWIDHSVTAVRPERVAVSEDEIELGKDEIAKMQFVLSRCLATADQMKKAEFIVAFGPHLYEGALCAADVNAALDDLLKDDAERLAAARTIATYGLHSLTEYVTLKGMVEGGQIEWDSLPVNRLHELHAAYVAALAREITGRIGSTEDFSVQSLRSITGETFLGEHFSRAANMSFGSHLQSLIEAGREGNAVDDFEKSRGLSLEQYVLRYGDDHGFVPSNAEEWRSTDAPAGSDAKVETLVGRVDSAQHLWHPEDRVDFTGVKLDQLSAAERANLAEREQELARREKLDERDDELKRKKAAGELPEPKKPRSGGPKKGKRLANEVAVA